MWNTVRYSPQSGLHPVSNPWRKDIRPLVYGLVADANGRSSRGNVPTEKFNGMGLKHGALNHGSGFSSTAVKPVIVRLATMVETYWSRLKPLMERSGMSIQKLADDLGVSFQAVAKVRDGGSFGSANNLKAAKMFGVNPEWLATGKGPSDRAANQDKSDGQHPLIAGAHLGAPVDRGVSYRPWTLPPLLSRETFMQAIDLPEAFTVAVPDDALAPSLTRGTEVVFRRAESAEPGQCVVVEDKDRTRYIRRFTQEPGGTWGAEAINKVYLSLHSERDGLKLLAVMAWRAESRV